ncbi:MAG: bifunctional DNA-formamidopyrimidine glycosylase/DNA-(apurinic or apyrimidinic site) lyase [Patescibacteria group bacterium]|nr:bifunctional DNA-formamidopyrimidine glycosylase/DNA-(apurinic or apyrimidinic site) lyase [Patescibacteria group bacterium]
MPELPEVETIVRGLNRKLKNRIIKDLWTDWPKYFKLPKSEKVFKKHVIGKKITKVSRRGKNVLIHLSDDHLLLIHQKISGHLMVGKWISSLRSQRGTTRNNAESLPEAWRGQKWIPNSLKGTLMDPMNRFIRLILFLDNGEMLALSDLRRFAKILCGPREIILNLPDLKNLGPDPSNLKFTYKVFRNLFENKKGRIKQVLMDQDFISGLGNIYADEVLWLAKIHPLRRVEKLGEAELKTVYRAIKKILRKALILRGASVSDYRDAAGRRGRYDLVRYAYQRENEPCPRCKTKIKRLKVGGRSAHFCPKCQRL